jgi:tetratricopeptide (TPR) repeat protein
MRIWIAPVVACAALAQQPPEKVQPPPAPSQQLPPDEDAPPASQNKSAAPSKPVQALPPDEDASPAKSGTAKAPDSDLPPDEDAVPNLVKHSFNPVESAHDVKVGEEYFKKGNYRAAAERFRDATEWNQGNAEAWLRLGEAEEKREQPKSAREAYQKYLQLAGNAKNAADVKKRLEKLK